MLDNCSLRCTILLCNLLFFTVLAQAGSFPHPSDPTLAAQERWGVWTQGYVNAGCSHSTSATTSVSVASCRAFVSDASALTLKGMEETTARTITYSGGDGTYVLGVRADPGVTPTGWTCVAGTHYCWIKKSAPGDHVDIPTNMLPIMQSIVSLGVVTEATTMGAPTEGTLLVACDQYADATVAIQAAVDRLPTLTGGEIVLQGRCRVTSEIVIAKSSVTIRGLAQSGRFRGDMDLDKSAAGAFIDIGANLTAGLFRFTSVALEAGLSSMGNTIRDLTIFGGGDTTSGRAFTVATAAVHVQSSDLMTVQNVRFIGILGRALWTERSVRSTFRNLDVTFSGDTAKPSIDVGDVLNVNFTQGSYFTNIRVEGNHLSPYFRMNLGARRNHILGLGFESVTATADTHQTFMDVDGFNAHQIENVHLNNPRSTNAAIIVRNAQNVWTNISSISVTNGPIMQLLAGAMNNVITGVLFESNISVAHDAFDIASDSNVISDVRLVNLGGFDFNVSSATVNTISNVYQTGGSSYLINDASNGRNRFYGMHKNGGSSSGRSIILAARDILVGGDIRSVASATAGVNANGVGGRISDMTIEDMAAAEGITVVGDDWQVTNNNVINVGQHCFRLTNARPGLIQHNRFIQCGTQTANTFHGIALLNDTGATISTQAVISNNTIRQGTADHLSSIHVTAGAASIPRYQNMIIVDNQIRDGADADIPPNDINNWVANFNQAFADNTAAANLNPPTFAGSVRVSGSTTITSITIRPPGPPLCLQFIDAVTVTDGGNLLLNGNFAATADDTLCLSSNGVNWFEVSRSVN